VRRAGVFTAEDAEGEERRGGEFNTKAQGHKGHKVQRVFGLLTGWNPHCRFQRQHGTFPEAPFLSELNGSLQGKFLFQKQVFEMRVPLASSPL